MKALVTRVHKGSVTVKGEITASIGNGIALFIGIENGDADNALVEIAQKVANLRIFENEQGKMHYSVRDENYQILCISNFTLCANTKKGRRPSFDDSVPPQEANRMFEDFVMILKSYGVDVKAGVFGAHMEIDIQMDGPVNIMLSG